MNLKYSAVKKGDVPVFCAATSQEESNLVINFLKADLVKSLDSVQIEWQNLFAEDVVVGVASLVWIRFNTIVVVEVTEYVHALPEVPLILICFHNLRHELSRVLHDVPYHVVELIQVQVFLAERALVRMKFGIGFNKSFDPTFCRYLFYHRCWYYCGINIQNNTLGRQNSTLGFFQRTPSET